MSETCCLQPNMCWASSARFHVLVEDWDICHKYCGVFEQDLSLFGTILVAGHCEIIGLHAIRATADSCHFWLGWWVMDRREHFEVCRRCNEMNVLFKRFVCFCISFTSTINSRISFLHKYSILLPSFVYHLWILLSLGLLDLVSAQWAVRVWPINESGASSISFLSTWAYWLLAYEVMQFIPLGCNTMCTDIYPVRYIFLGPYNFGGWSRFACRRLFSILSRPRGFWLTVAW